MQNLFCDTLFSYMVYECFQRPNLTMANDAERRTKSWESQQQHAELNPHQRAHPAAATTCVISLCHPESWKIDAARAEATAQAESAP